MATKTGQERLYDNVFSMVRLMFMHHTDVRVTRYIRVDRGLMCIDVCPSDTSPFTFFRIRLLSIRSVGGRPHVHLCVMSRSGDDVFFDERLSVMRETVRSVQLRAFVNKALRYARSPDYANVRSIASLPRRNPSASRSLSVVRGKRKS